MADKELKFYFFPGSFYSQKAYNALVEKGLPHKQILVNMINGEAAEPWYMRINKFGTVPCLVHGDKVIDDSQEICEYLDEAFPERPLVPKGPPEYRSKVIHCQQRLDSIKIEILSYGAVGHPQLQKGSWMPEVLRRKAFSTKTDEQNARTIARYRALGEDNPDLKKAYDKKIARVEDMVEKSMSKLTEEVVKKHMADAQEVLQEMENYLEENKKAGRADQSLCGADYTLADLILAITLYRITSDIQIPWK